MEPLDISRITRGTLLLYQHPGGFRREYYLVLAPPKMEDEDYVSVEVWRFRQKDTDGLFIGRLHHRTDEGEMQLLV